MSTTDPVIQQQAPQGPPPGGKGLAITALVLGIVSLLLCWVPILNNVIILPALVGIVLGVIGYLGARKGKRGGKGMALAGTILSVLALILIFVTQAFYVKTLDDISDELDKSVGAQSATSSTTATTPAAPASTDSDDTSDSPSSSSEYAVGDVMSLTLGSSDDEAGTIEVESVKVSTKALDQYGEKPQNGAYKIVKINFKNTGSDSFDVNPFDWYYLDGDGNKFEYGDGNYSGWDGKELGSTTLGAGEKRSGSIVFDVPKDATKLVYSPNFDGDAVATWTTK